MTKLIKGYTEFEGWYKFQMPKLIGEGLRPLATKHLMLLRIKAFESKDKSAKEFWFDYPFGTPDGLVNYDKNIIVIPYSELLMNVNKNSKLISGHMRITESEYNAFAKRYGVLKIDEVILFRGLTKKEAKEHPIWTPLAGNDRALVNDYTDVRFEDAKSRFRKDFYESHDFTMGYHDISYTTPIKDKIMSVHVPKDKKYPVLSYLTFWPYELSADSGFIPTTLVGVKSLESIVRK